MGSERREGMKALGMRLRGLRTEGGLAGAVVAQRAGVGQPTVSKVETGRMVPSAMDVYTHVVQDTQREAMSHMDRLLRKRRPGRQ
ncbi:hypothetical protein GCM10010249_23300 [Streptomyces roseolilacinus]|uniref:HTH cro/C1-type domain-containing protein n=1 Tax=Streptomyces roseolilacinus TaxID=66904 RepID=A0A918B159_9ACTN|nr:hypothetical protein GCM10010249_23300 [Streptomyces roseolilacinus]